MDLTFFESMKSEAAEKSGAAESASSTVNARATYEIGVWGMCPHFLRSEDGKPAASHNHRKCDCPACRESGQVWYRCIMTEKWLRESEIHKTQEQGG